MNADPIERLTGRNAIEVIGEITGLSGRLALRPEEVFEQLSIGRSAGYAGLRDGSIPGKRIGDRWVIPVPMLLAWLLDVEPEEPRDLRAIR